MFVRLVEYRPPRIVLALVIAASMLHVISATSSPYRFTSIYTAAALIMLGFFIMIVAWWQFKESWPVHGHKRISRSDDSFFYTKSLHPA